VISLINVIPSITLAASNVRLIDGWVAGIVVLTLWVSGFLGLLNIALAIFFRKKQKREVLSYYAACGIEIAIFVFLLLVYLGIISHVPYRFPQGLPFGRAQIGAALAIGVGLFPAAYWHRINVSDLPGRIAQDAKVIKEREGGVHVRKSRPGEWMN